MEKHMKTIQLLIAMFTSILLSSTLYAQSQIAVPLSKPGQPGTLEMNFIMADVTIEAYDGNEVVIRYEGDNLRSDNDKSSSSREGLRKIGGGGSGFEVTENNNKVVMDGGIPMGELEFEILVPKNFSLKISIVTGDKIEIKGVNGDHEINHVNGDIELTNVSGSALVNTVNGDINAVFSAITANKPMAFSNINGDIDVSIPASTKFTAKMRSEFGEMFTDFDMVMKNQTGPKVTESTGKYKVEVNNWVTGDVNGGGPEFLFKTLRGDFYLRKK
jgi:hypothetical protein